MAYSSSLEALKKSNISVDQIDMIIVATTTPERKFPSSAVLLQNKLKIEKGFAFDVNAAFHLLELMSFLPSSSLRLM